MPRAVLLDLDDTILDDSSKVDACWRDACLAHAGQRADIDVDVLHEAIDRTAKWYWGDPERHRIGRLDLDAARRHVVGMALETIGVNDPGFAGRVADEYSRRRDECMEPLSEAIETVRWLRARGSRLALLTNGSGPAQRRKIERFALAPLFDEVLIEGEVGFGKPDPRIYTLALERLGVAAADAWMVGDNLVWDVEQPQRMGLFAIWVDRKGAGLNASQVRPDRIVRALSDLRHE